MQRLRRAGLRSLASLDDVSLGSLLQDQLVQRQVQDRPAKTQVLLLQIVGYTALRVIRRAWSVFRPPYSFRQR